ncbi:AarF/ABC1/UbiB kinase family protein [Ectothiorhodospira haloalkaliphila]|uniref:ABC1 kinase family protein n=1 Tax=Ectothiorhodospira haloalkaliphila TaxID=421628 RepID=UPI001EE87FFC|nr:AarF/ABC1/UbiB kinase family protein [Ectothiorhodospira haloalkaliphila]MCG5525697.1 AarF/ABC1/UbiB kinase family protein [Ectothiorhodospira haloalkaliphila]
MSDHGKRRSNPVPSSRFGRLWHLGMASGTLAAGIGFKGLTELTRKSNGSRPARIDLPGKHAQRFTNRLARMRGAVMKMGQLMSMDGTDLLSEEASEIMGALRQGAEPMPLGQLSGVLNREYGKGWEQQFKHMDLTPIAAASIGQVHKAETRDGRTLALKIQFPGVRESIDSDINNLAFLFRQFRIMPAGVDLGPLFEEARLQLHRETDYQTEAESLTAYGAMVGDDPNLFVPRLHPDLSTENILAMDFAPGEPVDRMISGDYPREDRDRVATLLSRLGFRELFDFGLVQTDPNFSNYLYDMESGRVSLLDFGAAHRVQPHWVEVYRHLGQAAYSQDREDMRQACIELGYLKEDSDPADVNEMLDLLLLSGEPLRHEGPYDFGASDLFERVYYRGKDLFLDERFRHMPEPATLFLHRKFMGMFLLCRKLRARVDIGRMMNPHLGLENP